MKKVDLRKELKQLYQPPKDEVVLVDVPVMNYLMIDGEGDPNTVQSYRDALEALYPLSYTLKFMVKKGPQAVDYGVMPLEGLWWVDDMSAFTVPGRLLTFRCSGRLASGASLACKAPLNSNVRPRNNMRFAPFSRKSAPCGVNQTATMVRTARMSRVRKGSAYG
jgi:hypothetical protein